MKIAIIALLVSFSSLVLGFSKAETVTGTVIETMSTSSYTYVNVKTNRGFIWAAAPKTNVKKGESVTFSPGLVMRNFHSKKLNRDFSEIQFISKMTTSKGTPGVVKAKHGDITKKKIKNIKKADYTVGEIFKNSKKLKNKTVKVRAQVVKVSKQIMGMNWIHIQDNTGKKGEFDLVVTSNDMATVGDKILVSAKVITDKDFGYGYSYKVLLQEGRVTVEK